MKTKTIIFLLYSVIATAQSIKIPTTENTIYRISYQSLKNAGFPVTENPATFELLHRGIPQPFIITGNDNKFDETDFIEFEGKANDGIPDSALYVPASARPHAYYNLFSDTTWFYLTPYSTTTFTTPSLIATPLLKKRGELKSELIIFSDDFSFNSRSGPSPDLEQSYFEEGEGYTGKMIRGDSLASIKLAVPKDGIQVEMFFHGRDKNSRNVKIFADGLLQKTIIWEDFKTAKVSFSYLPKSDSILISTQAQKDNRYSWGYLKVTSSRDVALLRLINTVASCKDVTPLRLINTITSRKDVTPLHLTKDKSLNLNQLKGNYVIITHEKLLNSAQEYAIYRAKNFDILLVTVQQLYDTFTFGEKSPLAIIRFIKHLKQNNSLKHILLLGQATSIFDARDSEKDLVPTFGFPASDNLFLGKYEGISIGRISATKNEQILAYLNKVKEYENQEMSFWRKRILHLNGGRTTEELNTFKDILARQNPKIKTGIAGDVKAIQKNSIADVEKIDLSADINAGVAMLTFFGHSSPIQPDLDFGYVSNPSNNYQNKGKYPFMFFNGCGIGNVFYGGTPLSADWLLTPDKGAIAILAHSYTGFQKPLEEFTETFYSQLFSEKGNSIGEIHQNTIQILRKTADDAYKNANLDQMLLQGDPALVIFPSFDYTSLVNVENSVLVREFEENTSINVFPNPAFEDVHFKIKSEENQNSLHIYNAEGVLIKSFEINQTEQLDFIWESQNQPTGLYFYRLENKKQIVNGRFLICR